MVTRECVLAILAGDSSNGPIAIQVSGKSDVRQATNATMPNQGSVGWSAVEQL